MQLLNMFKLQDHQKVWDLLIYCTTCGFEYAQVKEMTEELGYYIPEDQFNAVEKLVNTQVDLDIGCRRAEWTK